MWMRDWLAFPGVGTPRLGTPHQSLLCSGTKVNVHEKRRLLLSDFNQNLNESTYFNKTLKHQILRNPFSQTKMAMVIGVFMARCLDHILE
jgi:hypothetical protein